jgi:transcriptional regulator with XRE-family HTH domain
MLTYGGQWAYTGFVENNKSTKLPKFGIRATARAAGISPSHASYIFLGKRRPSLGVARRIAKVCDMSLQELVDLMDATVAAKTS